MVGTWKCFSHTIQQHRNGCFVLMEILSFPPIGMPSNENVLTFIYNRFFSSMPILIVIQSTSVSYSSERWFKRKTIIVSQFKERKTWNRGIIQRTPNIASWLRQAILCTQLVLIVGIAWWLLLFYDEYLCCGYLRSSVQDEKRKKINRSIDERQMHASRSFSFSFFFCIIYYSWL